MRSLFRAIADLTRTDINRAVSVRADALIAEAEATNQELTDALHGLSVTGDALDAEIASCRARLDTLERARAADSDARTNDEILTSIEDKVDAALHLTRAGQR